MYMIATLLALSFAAVSANFLVEERLLQGQTVASAVSVSATCVRGTTESCSGTANTCCAQVLRNGTSLFGTTTNGICAPTEFNSVSFNVSGTNFTFTCAVAATVTTYNTNVAACPSAGCNSTQCCAPRTVTLNGTASTATKQSSCIDSTKAGNQVWNSYTTTTT